MPKSKYKILFFDADDTLFDFRQTEHFAFHAAMQKHDIKIPDNNFFTDYRRISFDLWQQLERNEISKEDLKSRRFANLFEKYGINSNPQIMSDSYLHLLTEKVFLIEQAREICLELQKHFTVAIITNGIDYVQRKRLEKSGLAKTISLMVVSEECGYAKPDRRIFDYSLSKSGHKPHEALMIGDRLETDILGAQNSEIDSCWYNPELIAVSADIKPTYQISDLQQLSKLILSAKS